jgi:hypothetical protein
MPPATPTITLPRVLARKEERSGLGAGETGCESLLLERSVTVTPSYCPVLVVAVLLAVDEAGIMYASSSIDVISE